ncbi:GSCFA domain-containing protein [Chitinophaga rhizophila]|uniref:GSCFA domain-containing protein n=1 Tax=Chitinophaga rhizophila TaxID=2866212 RepID=A0ABS7G6T1_9BACT|nr:GSCFA domain-containing protein [Chitinophaga rhizophila]MBW8683101.1 GSCFA domain-containing protein [Chitinophaga rhizophila]
MTNFRLTFPVAPLSVPLRYTDKILMVGSCFAEEIGQRLQQYHFDAILNPHGILYNPISITQALHTYLDRKHYTAADLFSHNDLWHSWDHHSRFSGMDQEEVLAGINAAQDVASARLEDADWLIITLGSAFTYTLANANQVVGNCHKVPSASFHKRLLSPPDAISALDNLMHRLFFRNRKVKIMFTISPVRYIRDGVIENNLSKAILMQTVHHLVNKFDRLYYFPGYELVIDDLRDYRFYNEDLVHPNELAVDYVWDHFTDKCLGEEDKLILPRVGEIIRARQHKPFNPDSSQHKQFLQTYARKTKLLIEEFPFLNMEEELAYFSQ